MGKYAPLGDYLRQQRGDEVALTFDEIERIIGAPLPPRAQHQRAWWSNNPANNVMTRVWLDAGFCTERVDIAARRLVFRRLHPARPVSARVAEPTATWEVRTMPSTTRHPLFGWMKGLVHVAPGADLTEPADPEWGELEGQEAP